MKLTQKDNVTAKNVGRWRLVKLTTKLYNNLCNDCKRKVINNPKIEFKDYCPNCQKKAEEIFGDLIK